MWTKSKMLGTRLQDEERKMWYHFVAHSCVRQLQLFLWREQKSDGKLLEWKTKKKNEQPLIRQLREWNTNNMYLKTNLCLVPMQWGRWYLRFFILFRRKIIAFAATRNEVVITSTKTHFWSSMNKNMCFSLQL